MSRDDYRQEVNRLIDEMTGEVALNGSHEHASIILERMFSRARRTVRILSRTLDPRIYTVPETLEACRRFLGDPARECRVIVEDFDKSRAVTDGFYRLVETYPNLIIKGVPEHLKKPIAISFALMDNVGYRFENDLTEGTAIAAFGEKELTPALDRVFDKLWAVSNQLPELAQVA